MFSLILLPLLERSFDRETNYNATTNKNRVSVLMDFYPFHMNLDIWVEAHNILGTAESEHLQQDADWFGKLLLSVYNVDLYVVVMVMMKFAVQSVTIRQISI